MLIFLMRLISLRQLLFLALALSVPLVGKNAFSDTIKPVLGINGRPPSTHLVELPQESVEIWKKSRVRKPLTVIVITGTPGLSPLSKRNFRRANALFRKNRWGELFSKGYPTVKNYPVNPGNYLWFAAREGMIREIYWAAPAKKSVSTEPIGRFRKFLKSIGLPERDLRSFRHYKKGIRGTMAGIPVRIYALKDLPRIRRRTVLLADPGFFKDLYKDEVKTPFLDLFGGVMNSLGSSGIRVSDAVVSYSSSLPPLSVKDRFIARYLYTYFSTPAKLRHGPPATWKLRAQAMYDGTFYQLNQVAQSYADAIKKDPKDPSLSYDMALALFTLKDLKGVRLELANTVGLDKNYYPAYLEMAGYFLSQKMPPDSEYFARIAVKINPRDPRCWEALYNALYAEKRYKEAVDALDKKIALGFDNLYVKEDYAQTLLLAGDYKKAAREYEEILTHITPVDRKVRPLFLGELAEAYEGEGRINKALDTYAQAADGMTDKTKKHILLERAAKLREKWKPFLSAPRKPQ
ncbi:MAG: tetratricopeptide repeat protein [Nitrospirota bacterium]